MKLSKLFWLCKLGVLVFFILLSLGLAYDSSVLIWIGVVILVIVALIFQFKYRCPYCHKLLNSPQAHPGQNLPPMRSESRKRINTIPLSRLGKGDFFI